MKKNLKNNITLGVIFFIIGIFIGKYLHLGIASFDTNINILDALTLLTTIGIAFYVSNIIERDAENNRVEKDMYIMLLTEINELLRKLEDLSQQKEPLLGDITSYLTQCRRKYQFFSRNCEKNFPSVKTGETKNKLDNLYDTMTRTSIDPSESIDLKVVDSHVEYSNNLKRMIAKNISIIEDDIFQLKVLINND